MLTDNIISVKRIVYACCSLSYLAATKKAQKYGDIKCAESERRLWLYMLWSKSIADRVALSTESFNKCVTAEFAEAVFAKADCYCSSCGCPPANTPYPPVDPCIRVAQHTAIAAVDVADRATIEASDPPIGSTYYLVTDTGGSWGSGLNTLQTWLGGGTWSEVTVAAGEYVDILGTLWTVTVLGVPGLADPTVTVTWVGPPDLYIIQSDYPIIAEASTRTATAEVFGVGGWVPIFLGPESQLADPVPFNITGYNMDNVMVTYTQGSCSYTAGGEIEPPGCTFPRDHDCLDHDTLAHS